jgi:hypothetical protein
LPGFVRFAGRQVTGTFCSTGKLLRCGRKSVRETCFSYMIKFIYT